MAPVSPVVPLTLSVIPITLGQFFWLLRAPRYTEGTVDARDRSAETSAFPPRWRRRTKAPKEEVHMVGRTFVLWLGLALGAGSLWAPTVASMEALEAQSQWQQARRVARPYRTALRADSVRLTDSLAYQILRTA